jgi:hypothetical protein
MKFLFREAVLHGHGAGKTSGRIGRSRGVRFERMEKSRSGRLDLFVAFVSPVKEEALLADLALVLRNNS